MSGEQTVTLEDIKEEIKAVAFSRFNSPFLAALTISWFAWNHRLIFVLFSDQSVADRFSFIDEKLYPTLGEFLTLNFGGPLASALIYIFLLPWPTEWVHRWNLQRKLKLRYADLRAEGHRLLTEEESVRMRQSINEMKEQLNDRRIDLLASKRKNKALAFKITQEAGEELKLRIYRDYLTSQPFKIALKRGNAPDYLRFLSDGATELPGHANVRWYYSKNSVHFVDTDREEGAMGSITFNPGTNTFIGTLGEFGEVRISGVHQERDFAL